MKCETRPTPELEQLNIALFIDGVEIRALSQCWPWLKGLIPSGYGSFSVHDRTYLAHRISWILNNDSVPEGLCVLHKCDNKLCVNPNHLFLGTLGDNCRDMKNKGRAAHPIGELHPLHKLTWTKVDQIRQLAQSGTYSNEKLAQMFEVDPSSISKVLHNHIWRREP